MRRPRPFTLTHPALLTCALIGVTLSPSGQAGSAGGPPSPLRPLLGDWRGTLEYQDYGADRRVRVPVKLRVTGENNATRWLFRYDDFGLTVSSDERHTWQDGTYRVVTAGQPGAQVYRGNLNTLLTDGVAVLLGTQQENGRPVQVRRTLKLTDLTFETLTETREAGQPFRFRNRSTYTRS